MRLVIRDAEWVIRRTDYASDNGYQLTCEGISEMVRGHQGIFLTKLESHIQILNPAETKIIADMSPGYADSLLYMESLLRQRASNDASIQIAHQAAMNRVPYQFDPALQALQQPRQRILIADAVGLGKTLEIHESESLFPSHYAWCKAALKWLQNRGEALQVTHDDASERVSLYAKPGSDLDHRCKFLPREIMPENRIFILTANKDTITEEVNRCRQDESAWPKQHLLSRSPRPWLVPAWGGLLCRTRAPILINVLQHCCPKP